MKKVFSSAVLAATVIGFSGCVELPPLPFSSSNGTAGSWFGNSNKKTYFSDTDKYAMRAETIKKFDSIKLHDNISSQNFDIAGIKIGNKYPNMQTKLKTINSKYKFKTGEEIAYAEFVAENGYDKFTVANDHSGKVFFLRRDQKLDNNNRVDIDVFLNSLFEKYGRPSKGSNPEKFCYYHWFYDRSGEQFFQLPDSSRSADFGPCVNADLGYNDRPPFKISGTCGRLIQVKCIVDRGTSTSRATNLVTSFSITIVDYKDMFDKLNADDQRRVQEAKKNAPKL